MYNGGEKVWPLRRIFFEDTRIPLSCGSWPDGDSYGYRISKRRGRSRSDGGLELKEATLYTAFPPAGGRRAASAPTGATNNSGARRRYYALTDAGRERLTQDCAVWQETRSAD